MRLPRFRVRTLMIAVAVLAVLLAAEGYRRRVRYLRMADAFARMQAEATARRATVQGEILLQEVRLKAIEAQIAGLRRPGDESPVKQVVSLDREGKGQVIGSLVKAVSAIRSLLKELRRLEASIARREAACATETLWCNYAARRPWLSVAPDPPEPK